MVRSQRRRSNRGANRNTRRIRRVVSQLDYGVKFVPSVDPPEYSRSPWWSFTLVSKPEKLTTYGYDLIQEGLLASMGWSSIMSAAPTPAKITNPFCFRIQSVRVWGLEKQAISLDVNEVVGTTHRIKQLADMGSGINFSRLGWKFGVAAQIDPGTSLDVSKEHPLFTVGGTGKMLVYIQLLFSNAGAPYASLASSKVVSSESMFGFMHLG